MIDGLVVVDKPAGMTSHDVVGRCRRIFGQRRVGHAGTLDPDATGVLLVGLGRATRLLQWVSGLEKRYEGEVVCGVSTTTLDESGEVTGRWDMAHVGIEEARRMAETLTGELEQIPPMVSAVKVGGRRLHQLAREGLEVDRPARHVRVMRFDLDVVAQPHPGPYGGGPVLAVTVECSSGTYIRVLAADLGQALGGGAYLRALRRTAIGPWSVSDAVALDDLGEADVLPPVRAVTRLEVINVDGQVAADVSHGRVLDRAGMAIDGEGPWAVIGGAGELLAVYEVHGPNRIKPAVVLVEASGPGPAR
jgi:tRNA pseudouridine55 synthase